MQGLGATHVEQIKHKYVEIDGALADTFGKMPLIFQALVFGDNGNGKTELGFLMIKELCKHDRVDWISYEQGHGSDIQETIIRHRVKADKWDVVFFDPYKKRNFDQTVFDELCLHLDKPKSAKFIVIDSVDACGFSPDQYRKLMERYSRKKTFIWLSYEGSNKKPLTALARRIGGEGHYIIRVKDFIAQVKKSRYGGWKDFIIYEKKARERNPLYFELKEAEVKKEKRKAKKHGSTASP